MIIAAQAEQLGAVLATSNAKHFAGFVDARDWKDIEQTGVSASERG
jgi:predicted nucleic acid-binding protein